MKLKIMASAIVALLDTKSTLEESVFWLRYQYKASLQVKIKYDKNIIMEYSTNACLN